MSMLTGSMTVSDVMLLITTYEAGHCGNPSTGATDEVVM